MNRYFIPKWNVGRSWTFLASGYCSPPPTLSAGWIIIPFKAHSESCNDFSSAFGGICYACSTFAQTAVINCLEILSLSVASLPSLSLSYLRARARSYCLWILAPESWSQWLFAEWIVQAQSEVASHYLTSRCSQISCLP